MIGHGVGIKRYRPATGIRGMTMKCRHAALLLTAMVATNSAPAQFKAPLSEELLTAIKEGNSGRVVQLVDADGAALINTRSYDGSTALTLTVKARNGEFTDYLLTHGANPDQPGIGNEPPLVIAARLGWSEGVDHLLQMRAKVDAPNRQGETALIVAVQARNTQVVRRLLQAGADPDRADSSAGMSARDYAKRDNRVREILTVIERVRPTKR